MELGDDAPPEEIWLDPEAVSDHFDRVKDKHKNPDMESIDEPTTQNELTAQIRK